MALVYALGPVSGCHVNPAVTIGFLVARRIGILDAIGYWVAQLIGAVVGAGALYGVFHSTPRYTGKVGLGTDGYGASSIIHANAAGALAAEVVLTFLFVFVILSVTRRASNATVVGLVIGLTLAVVHLVGIPIDGTSVNPAPEEQAASARPLLPYLQLVRRSLSALRFTSSRNSFHSWRCRALRVRAADVTWRRKSSTSWWKRSQAAWRLTPTELPIASQVAPDATASEASFASQVDNSAPSARVAPSATSGSGSLVAVSHVCVRSGGTVRAPAFGDAFIRQVCLDVFTVSR
jgi:Major intrinsic protein